MSNSNDNDECMETNRSQENRRFVDELIYGDGSWLKRPVPLIKRGLRNRDSRETKFSSSKNAILVISQDLPNHQHQLVVQAKEAKLDKHITWKVAVKKATKANSVKSKLAPSRQSIMAVELTQPKSSKSKPAPSQPYSHSTSDNDKFTGPGKKCGETFTRQFSLGHHLKKKHNFYKDKKGAKIRFECDVSGCSSTFAWKADVKVHMENVHAQGQNQLSCKFCGGTYKSKKSLRDHQTRSCKAKLFVKQAEVTSDD